MTEKTHTLLAVWHDLILVLTLQSNILVGVLFSNAVLITGRLVISHHPAQYRFVDNRFVDNVDVFVWCVLFVRVIEKARFVAPSIETITKTWRETGE